MGNKNSGESTQSLDRKKQWKTLHRVAGDPRKFSIIKQNRNMQSMKKKGKRSPPGNVERKIVHNFSYL